MNDKNKVLDALLGVVIGDALGVPFEFNSHTYMAKNPASEMIGYGTHHQPPGTWSDDSSLTLCLAEALVGGYSLKSIAARFVNWRQFGYWTARGEIFDIGGTTNRAINRLRKILKAEAFEELSQQKGLGDDTENGNGSLMRILPLLFYIKRKLIQEQFDIIWDVSALTHRHIRAAMACLIYLKMAEHILAGKEKEIAYSETRTEILAFWDEIDFTEEQRSHFEFVIQNDVRKISYSDLKSGGYVIEALEAAFWCFMSTENFEDSLFKGINKGHDTDTIAAITGGLSGLYYGRSQMPDFWVAQIARLEDIEDLAEKLNNRYT